MSKGGGIECERGGDCIHGHGYEMGLEMVVGALFKQDVMRWGLWEWEGDS